MIPIAAPAGYEENNTEASPRATAAYIFKNDAAHPVTAVLSDSAAVTQLSIFRFEIYIL
jgi:hypothetical protein